MDTERKGGRFKKPGVPDLGARIKSLMGDTLSASELSARSGVSSSYLSRIIQGEVTNPTLDYAVRIGEGLGVTVSELIGQTPLSQNGEVLLPSKNLELRYVPVNIRHSIFPKVPSFQVLCVVYGNDTCPGID